jgi:deoxyadenosine/deoxycytidine kinase
LTAIGKGTNICFSKLTEANNGRVGHIQPQPPNKSDRTAMSFAVESAEFSKRKEQRGFPKTDARQQIGENGCETAICVQPELDSGQTDCGRHILTNTDMGFRRLCPNKNQTSSFGTVYTFPNGKTLRRLVLTVSGNIGGGKSTTIREVLSLLRQLDATESWGEKINVYSYEENIEGMNAALSYFYDVEKTRIIPMFDDGLYEMSAFGLQSIVMQQLHITTFDISERTKAIYRQMEKDPGMKSQLCVFLVERTPYDSIHVFTELNKGRYSPAQLKSLNQNLEVMKETRLWKEAIYCWLDVPIETCVDRIMNRNRESEVGTTTSLEKSRKAYTALCSEVDAIAYDHGKCLSEIAPIAAEFRLSVKPEEPPKMIAYKMVCFIFSLLHVPRSNHVATEHMTSQPWNVDPMQIAYFLLSVRPPPKVAYFGFPRLGCDPDRNRPPFRHDYDFSYPEVRRHARPKAPSERPQDVAPIK